MTENLPIVIVGIVESYFGEFFINLYFDRRSIEVVSYKRWSIAQRRRPAVVVGAKTVLTNIPADLWVFMVVQAEVKEIKWIS